MENEPTCEHLQQITAIIQPKNYVCEECIKTGDDWMHLRTCQTCGVTLCCDSSPNKHATQHYHATQHPVVYLPSPASNGYGVLKMRRLGSISISLLS